TRPTLLVRRLRRLRPDTFMTLCERLFVECLRCRKRARHESRDQVRRGYDARERLEALARGSLREAARVEPQAVEIERTHRQLDAQPLDVEPAAKAAHRCLERMRTSRLRERDRLAVEHELLGR